MSKKRDEMMRVIGNLEAAIQLVEKINVESGHLQTLVELAAMTLNKAMLEAWAQATQPGSEGEQHG